MKLWAVSLLLAGLFAGCATPPAPVAGQGCVEDARVLGSCVKGGKFSRLQLGMTREAVEALIGQPESIALQPQRTTGLAYVVGTESWSTESSYSGEGRLVFDSASRLVLIDAR